MERRNFIKSSCTVACACIASSVVGILQSCEDNIDESHYNNENENDDTKENQITVDISSSPHLELNNINGTSYLGSNAIDSLGLLLVRSSETTIKAFSRRCPHASYSINSFNIEGTAICSSGHGGSFNLNGNVTGGPPSYSLQSYSTSLSDNQLIIRK